MPKVMMISGVPTLGRGGAAVGPVPRAGAYQQPIGRLIGRAHLGGAQGLSAASIRSGLMAPLLRGAGVGAMQQFIPGAMQLPQLGAMPQQIADRYSMPLAVPRSYRNEVIPGAVRLPQLGYIPGQNHLPTLRGGLGDIDFCTDPGWVFANNILAAGGAAMSTLSADQTRDGETTAGDGGWQAAGGVTTGAATAWRNSCSQIAQNQARAAAAAADPTEADYLRRQLELESIRRTADGDAYARFASTAAGGASTTPSQVPDWVWYAGAAVGIGAVAYMVLGGKRRRRR